jgi:KaiC/GvpD/RAD55 family RecA-like ATPase
VLLRGPSGVGKTTLAQNLGLTALQHGYTVRFVTLASALADLLACTGPSRSPIPGQADHRFRAKPITDSGPSRSVARR